MLVYDGGDLTDDHIKALYVYNDPNGFSEKDRQRAYDHSVRCRDCRRRKLSAMHKKITAKRQFDK